MKWEENQKQFIPTMRAHFIQSYSLKTLVTNTHAAYVERLIRTIKSYIYKRVERYKKSWINYLKIALNYYNNSHTHATTK